MMTNTGFRKSRAQNKPRQNYREAKASHVEFLKQNL